MSYVMFTAREQSALVFNAPTFAAIQSALSPANGRFNGSRESKTWIGRWVGPSPRVTRTTQPGSASAGFVTNAAWLWEWNEENVNAGNVSAYNQQLQTYLRDQLLQQSSDWSQMVVSPYVAGANGTPEWWRNGNAAVTQTRNDFPTGISRLGTDDNPVGPTTGDTVPTPNLGSVADGVGGAAKNIAIAAGVLLVGYLVFEAVGAAKTMKRNGAIDRFLARGSRSNPRRSYRSR